jgi:hypothetical protein
MHWHLPRSGHWTAGIASSPPSTAICWPRSCPIITPVRSYCVSFARRAIAGPGRIATLSVLTSVVQVFENFRCQRAFVGRSHDATLEFSTRIGKGPLKGVDLLKFDEAGKIIEFEVMIRPLKALAALADEIGNRIGPALTELERAAAIWR